MKVVCFGDSNTYGFDPRSYLGGRYPSDSRWVDLLEEKTGWEVCNQGENGREIPGRPVPVPADTDLLIVMLGTNDLLQGRTPAAVTEDMRRFLESLPLERQKMLLIAPPPMVPGTWVQHEQLVEYSHTLARCYRELARKLGIRFADAGAWQISLAFDGVHFTEQGHKAFARGLTEEVTI